MGIIATCLQADRSNYYGDIPPKRMCPVFLRSVKESKKMAILTIQSLEQKKLQKTLQMLREGGELSETGICPLCNCKIEEIGGFIPHEGKVSPICDKLSCILQASYEVMKFNGNGSPVIDESR